MDGVGVSLFTMPRLQTRAVSKALSWGALRSSGKEARAGQKAKTNTAVGDTTREIDFLPVAVFPLSASCQVLRHCMPIGIDLFLLEHQEIRCFPGAGEGGKRGKDSTVTPYTLAPSAAPWAAPDTVSPVVEPVASGVLVAASASFMGSTPDCCTAQLWHAYSSCSCFFFGLLLARFRGAAQERRGQG